MAPSKIHQVVENETLSVRLSPGRGKGTFAGQSIQARDQVIYVTNPPLIALQASWLPSYCYFCFASPTDQTSVLAGCDIPALKQCSACKVARFCGKACQRQAWSQFHRWECDIFVSQYPRILPAEARAIIRLLKQHEAGILPDGVWDQILALGDHQDDHRRTGGAHWQDLLLFSSAIQKLAATAHSPDVILRLMCMLCCNAFGLCNSVNEFIGVVLHPRISLFNHSCNPSAFVRFDVTKPSPDTNRPPHGTIALHALRSIGKDEEITLPYTDVTSSFRVRQAALRQQFFFDCACDRCARGEEAPLDRIWPSEPPTPAMTASQMLAIEEEGERAEKAARDQPNFNEAWFRPLDAAMFRVAQTKTWPLQRYPWPQLRHQLVRGHVSVGNLADAFLQQAVLVRRVIPQLFEPAFHPLRVNQVWSLSQTTRILLEAEVDRLGPSAGHSGPSADGHGVHNIDMLGLLDCVLGDELHELLCRAGRVHGLLERGVDAVRSRLTQEVFWPRYQRDVAGGRATAGAWLDRLVRDQLTKEGVTPRLIDAVEDAR